MIISLCGDLEDKKIVINELEEIYKDKLLICDYFQICFKNVIENEKIKYKLQNEYNDFYKANRIFNNYIKRIVDKEMNSLLDKNKDKIILLMSDNVISRDIDKTPFFKKSDLKILITSDKKCKYPNSIRNHNNLYNKNKFDYVIDVKEKIDVKKLVKS